MRSTWPICWHAVRDNRSLVQVGDREFARISDAFRRRLQQLGDAVVDERGSLKVADAAVPAVQELIGDDVPLEATARWHESIERLESLADWTPEKPAGLDAQLRDYQLDGYRWLARLSQWGVGGVLADDMGLGKTVQALGAWSIGPPTVPPWSSPRPASATTGFEKPSDSHRRCRRLCIAIRIAKH